MPEKYKLQFTVTDYDEMSDTFTATRTIEEDCLSVQEEINFEIPAILMPHFADYYGEPSEFLGNTYSCEMPDVYL